MLQPHRDMQIGFNAESVLDFMGAVGVSDSIRVQLEGRRERG